MNTSQREQVQANPHHAEKTSSGRAFVLHPFLFALYPVLALLAVNIQEVDPTDTFRSLIVVLVTAAIFICVFRLIFHDWQKAGIITSLLLILFFSYGHIYMLLKTISIAGFAIGRHRFLIPFMGFILIVGIWFLATRIRNLNQITRFLNITALVSLILPSYTIANFIFHKVPEWEPEIADNRSEGGAVNIDQITSLPDIYYIIVDAYAREDILREQYDYDNSGFIDFLRDRGFYVADQSNTNYMWTTLSLVSSLNLDYVTNLGVDLTEGYYPYNLESLLQKSTVRLKLEELGYSTVSMSTGYRPTELKNADYYLTPDMTNFDVIGTVGGFNAFEGMLFRNTAGLILVDLDILLNTDASRLLADQLNRPHQVQRLIILAEFDHLKYIPEIPEPKFVFVHIVSPHRPYLFGPNGENTDNTEAFTLAEGQSAPDDKGRYRDQLNYITTRLESTVDAILSGSNSRPIIILQSDHGTGVGMDWENPSSESIRARAGILNAYYIEERCQTQLSPDIMPVNTFRVIFNCYFGETYKKLEEISYFNYVRGNDPFNFIPIEEILE
jgi:hypothetical protein